MPVEFGLELVTIIGANSIDPEWEFGDDVIHEVDRILLRMPFINLQGANTGGIINCCVLEIPDLAAFLSLEIKEFHIDLHENMGSGLDMMVFCVTSKQGVRP